MSLGRKQCANYGFLEVPSDEGLWQTGEPVSWWWKSVLTFVGRVVAINACSNAVIDNQFDSKDHVSSCRYRK